MDLLPQIVAQYDQLKYALLKVQTFDQTHYGFPPLYYEIMESDQVRIGAFQRAFAAYDFRDKVVCEAGVGRLALSQFYLPDVKKAYLIENNPALRPFIEQWLQERNWSEKVELIVGDARQVVLPEPIDCLIGEMMSIWAINEHQVPVFQHLRQFLKPGGQLFPERIINIVQLAQVSFEHGHQHYPINFSRHLPEQLSLPVIAHTIDLYEEHAAGASLHCALTPHLSGQANAVFLQSAVQISSGHNFTGTDSLMPPTVCRLKSERFVQAGEAIQLHCSLRYGSSLDEALFMMD